MKHGFVKIALVVAVVLGLTTAGVCTLLMTDPGVARSGEDYSFLPADDSQEEAPWPDVGLEPGAEYPPGEEPPGQSGNDNNPVESKSYDQAGTENENHGPPIDEDFDPMLGEASYEGQVSDGPINQEMAVPEGANPDQQAQYDVKDIDDRAEKISRRLTQKVNKLSARLKLDAGTAESLLEISLDGLQQIADERKRFAGQAMTESDKSYFRDTVKIVNARTTQAIYNLLGPEKFKDYKKESRYYDNPQARLLDEMNAIKKQNQQLQKKVEKSNRRPKRSSNRRLRR